MRLIGWCARTQCVKFQIDNAVIKQKLPMAYRHFMNRHSLMGTRSPSWMAMICSTNLSLKCRNWIVWWNQLPTFIIRQRWRIDRISDWNGYWNSIRRRRFSRNSVAATGLACSLLWCTTDRNAVNWTSPWMRIAHCSIDNVIWLYFCACCWFIANDKHRQESKNDSGAMHL